MPSGVLGHGHLVKGEDAQGGLLLLARRRGLRRAGAVLASVGGEQRQEAVRAARAEQDRLGERGSDGSAKGRAALPWQQRFVLLASKQQIVAKLAALG